MSRVLAFGDDRSAGANLCWDWIVAQRWDGWRLEVVTAEPPDDFRPVQADTAELHPWEPVDPRSPADRGFVEVEHLTAELDPRVALIARSWDLVAIGPRSDGRLGRLGLGSTADWLLREPTSPLLIARKTGPVKGVLLAVDGSLHAARAMATLASVPWLEGVAVRVVAVEDGHVDAEAALRDASATLSAAGADVESVTRTGRATKAIVEDIEHTSPDLIVMGARGEGGLKRLVLGSTTVAVASSTECSLLVAHAQEEPGD